MTDDHGVRVAEIASVFRVLRGDLPDQDSPFFDEIREAEALIGASSLGRADAERPRSSTTREDIVEILQMRQRLDEVQQSRARLRHDLGSDKTEHTVPRPTPARSASLAGGHKSLPLTDDPAQYRDSSPGGRVRYGATGRAPDRRLLDEVTRLRSQVLALEFELTRLHAESDRLAAAAAEADDFLRATDQESSSRLV